MIQDTHHLSVRRNGDVLALGFDLGPVSFGKYPRGNNHQVLPEGNLAAQIVGETAGGVGDVLAPKLIAEIGDVRRLHSAKALIAWAGIDPPPYESGQFVGSKRRITKRGSSTLRKVGYEVMRVLKSHKAPKDDVVYNYILKKEREGKDKKHAKIAGLNKFLRIYYARVMAVYQ